MNQWQNRKYWSSGKSVIYQKSWGGSVIYPFLGDQKSAIKKGLGTKLQGVYVQLPRKFGPKCRFLKILKYLLKISWISNSNQIQLWIPNFIEFKLGHVANFYWPHMDKNDYMGHMAPFDKNTWIEMIIWDTWHHLIRTHG